MPEASPGLPAVSGFVGAVALLDVAPQLGLPRADVDHVGIRLAYRHRTHGGATDLPVRDGHPRGAAVGGLPEATPDSSEVVLKRPAVAAGDTDGAAAPVRAHTGPSKCIEEPFIIGHLGGE